MSNHKWLIEWMQLFSNRDSIRLLKCKGKNHKAPWTYCPCARAMNKGEKSQSKRGREFSLTMLKLVLRWRLPSRQSCRAQSLWISRAERCLGFGEDRTSTYWSSLSRSIGFLLSSQTEERRWLKEQSDFERLGCEVDDHRCECAMKSFWIFTGYTCPNLWF